MRENTINTIYLIQNPIIFFIVWFKTEVWWQGLVGIILLPIICGIIHGIFTGIVLKIRGRPFQKYPIMFYFEVIILAIYYFIF